MTVITTGPSVPQVWPQNPQPGDMKYWNGTMNVYDGHTFVPIQNEVIDELSTLDKTRLIRLADNLEKYEEILKDHFPEDFL